MLEILSTLSEEHDGWVQQGGKSNFWISWIWRCPHQGRGVDNGLRSNWPNHQLTREDVKLKELDMRVEESRVLRIFATSILKRVIFLTAMGEEISRYLDLPAMPKRRPRNVLPLFDLSNPVKLFQRRGASACCRYRITCSTQHAMRNVKQKPVFACKLGPATMRFVHREGKTHRIKFFDRCHRKWNRGYEQV